MNIATWILIKMWKKLNLVEKMLKLILCFEVRNSAPKFRGIPEGRGTSCFIIIVPIHLFILFLLQCWRLCTFLLDEILPIDWGQRFYNNVNIAVVEIQSYSPELSIFFYFYCRSWRRIRWRCPWTLLFISEYRIPYWV